MEFAIQAFLSFLVGGAYVSLILLLSEKIGSRIGGALAGTPTTTLVALVFIALLQGEEAARIGASVIPVILVLALIFAWVFVLLAKSKPNLLAMVTAICVWGSLALVVKTFVPEFGITLSVIICLLGIGGFHYIFRDFPEVSPNKQQSSKIYLARFIVAGSVIAGAVVAARLLGPVWGGVFSGFPGLFVTTLYFLNRSQGIDFTKGFVKRLPLGLVSILVFVITLYVLLLKLPATISFLVAFAMALSYTYFLLSARHFQQKLSKHKYK